MKFVALFALCCSVGIAFATHDEAVESARHGDLESLNLELLEDRKPVVRTRDPLENLDLGATGKPATPEVAVEPEENSHHGIGSGHAVEPAATSTTDLPVVTAEVTSSAASEPTEATSVPVTAVRTDAPATAEPAATSSTDASRVSSTSETANTDASATSESSNTDPTPSESSNTDSSNTGKPTESTDSSNTEPSTDSSNTAPTTDPTGEGNGDDDKKPKGLSTASISAIVIGGVLALAVVVAVAMAIVRRRRMAPERRGILDA